MLRLVFLGNCGCFLSDGTAGLLLDAPNGLHTLFDSVSEELMDDLADGRAPLDGLCGVMFTHRHNDHYDKHRLKTLCERRGDIQVFDTNGATPLNGLVQMGPFSVQYASIAHSGNEFATVPHRVFWITIHGKSVYFTGDAWWQKEHHEPVWRGRTPTVGIWNPNFINHPEGRQLMQCCQHNVICHIPVSAQDVFGIGAKCEHSVQRFQDELPDLTCVRAYPTIVEYE